MGGTGLLDAFTRLVPVGPEPDASPEEVHQWWLALTPAQQLAATLVQSRTYGNTDGDPGRRCATWPTARTSRSTASELLAQLDDPASYDPDADPGLVESFLLNGEDLQVREKLRALDELETVLGRGDRQLLLLDPFDGQQLHAAVAVGDVDTADHVSVFTPGFTSTVQDSLAKYDAATCSDLQATAAQQSRMYGDGGTVATVTWMGYDAPQIERGHRLAPLGDHAEPRRGRAATTSPRSTRASTPPVPSDPHLTALGHSYGSLTTGYALQHDGTGVDDAVLFGSPGHRHLGPLRPARPRRPPVRGRGGRRPGGRPRRDAAPFGVDPSHMDGVDFLSTHERDLPDGGHGSGSSGHSEYLEDDTTAQYNLAVTVAGLPEDRPVDRGGAAAVPGRPTRPATSTARSPTSSTRATRPGRVAVEVTGELVEDGLDEAWDPAKDFRLPDPVVHVPW